jgi:hypothetical protein
MKKLFEDWRQVVSEQTEGTKGLSSFYGLYQPGMVRLFHFTSAGRNSDSLVIDPNKFGKNYYTRRDVNASGFPRSYFYTDVSHTEVGLVTGGNESLFYVDVDQDKLYDCQGDPDKLAKKHKHETYARLEWDNLFRDVKENFNYTGMYYHLGYEPDGIPVVMCFEPLEATKTTVEEQVKLLSQR